MSYDTKQDTITVNNVVYEVERSNSVNCMGDTLTIEEFPGLVAYLGMEEIIENYMSPRDWSNVGTMACHYSGYDLGDKDVDPRDFIDNEVECPMCKGDGWREFGDEGEKPCGNCDGNGYVTQSLTEWVRREYGARVIIPLFVYEHSGITMSAGTAVITNADASDPDFNRTSRFVGDDAGWDTSSVGVIFDTPEGVQQCIGDDATDEQIEAALRSEVEVYASYLEGDVSYYRVEDEETGYDEGCGGFVGASKEAESECFSAIEAAIVKRLAEETERAHWLARGVETI